jgi:3-oxoacyl-[acyl-carrier protein] reductase
VLVLSETQPNGARNRAHSLCIIDYDYEHRCAEHEHDRAIVMLFIKHGTTIGDIDMSHRFKNKHVLVTGAAMSIGYEIARQFGAEGATVSIFDYNQEALEKATAKLRECGYSVHPYGVNVSERQQVIEAVDAAEQIAPIDCLVNNAAICLVTPFLSITPEEWNKTININLTGAFHVAQRVCHHMAPRKKGVVLNMSSKNGLDGEFGHAHYNASKAGLILMTKTIALELGHLGIRANAICPGYTRTAMNLEVDSDEFVSEFVDRYVPANRPGQVTDIAPLFLFLASDEAVYINGQTFVIDGGQLAGQKPWDGLLKDAVPKG